MIVKIIFSFKDENVGSPVMTTSSTACREPRTLMVSDGDWDAPTNQAGDYNIFNRLI